MLTIINPVPFLDKLAISVARKIGCLVFVVPEDLVEVRQKLVLTFIGAIMAATA